MPDSIMFHDGNRQLQDAFESRRIADRLEEKLTRTAFTADDKAFIESAIYFFLATADADGRPDCSFKGGAPGFVRVTAPDELAFPDYDGNGMFKSLGNLAVNANVGLLFIDLHERPRRLRVNGVAMLRGTIRCSAQTVGAQLIVRVKARAIFPNCPRYIPKLQMAEPSKYVPRPGSDPLEPAWKGFDDFKDHVHPRQPTFTGEAGHRLTRAAWRPPPARGRLRLTRTPCQGRTPHEDAARHTRPAARPALSARRGRRPAAHNGARRPWAFPRSASRASRRH